MTPLEPASDCRCGIDPLTLFRYVERPKKAGYKAMQRSSPGGQDAHSSEAPQGGHRPEAGPFDRAGGEWKERLKDIVRRNHRLPIFALLARASKTYLRAYYNENHYRFPHNGERFVIETFRRIKGDSDVVAFDVGAHTGSWTGGSKRLTSSPILLRRRSFTTLTCDSFDGQRIGWRIVPGSFVS